MVVEVSGEFSLSVEYRETESFRYGDVDYLCGSRDLGK